MEIEFRVDPDEAARLPRLKPLAGGGAHRRRAKRQHIVWHDTPDGALAEAGLAAAETREGWALVRLIPGSGHWPPGAPVPVLARAADRAGLNVSESLAPVAGFDGRLTIYEIVSETGSVTIALLRGVIRSVARERPACRITIAGEDEAVLHTALALTDQIPLEVAATTLAAEAIAFARDTPPAPRREGAPDLPEGLSVPDALRFVIGHLTDVILHVAPFAARGKDSLEPVHQMRVAVRRLRSALSVFRAASEHPRVKEAAEGLKLLGAQLGPARDWDVFTTETLAAVAAAIGADIRMRRLVAAAERRRLHHHAALQSWLQDAAFRRLGIELAWLAESSCCETALAGADGEPPADLLEYARDALDRRLHRLTQRADNLAELDAAEMHAVRLQAKRLRYMVEIFAPLFPAKSAKRYTKRLSALQERLGMLNDGAVARGMLQELGGPGGRHGYAVGVVEGFVAARAEKSRERIMSAWEKLERHPRFW